MNKPPPICFTLASCAAGLSPDPHTDSASPLAQGQEMIAKRSQALSLLSPAPPPPHSSLLSKPTLARSWVSE